MKTTKDDRSRKIRIEPVLELKRYINRTPELLSLLYDMDLLPEQVKEGERDWGRMLMLAEAWKDRKQCPNIKLRDRGKKH